VTFVDEDEVVVTKRLYLDAEALTTLLFDQFLNLNDLDRVFSNTLQFDGFGVEVVTRNAALAQVLDVLF